MTRLARQGTSRCVRVGCGLVGMARQGDFMKYQNGVKYTGRFAGVEVVFELHNFSPAIADRFNHFLAEEGRKSVERDLSFEAERPLVVQG